MEDADCYAIGVIAEATIWGKLGFLWLLDPQLAMTPDKPDNIEIDDDIKLEPYELNDQFSTWGTWYTQPFPEIKKSTNLTHELIWYC